MDSFRAAQSQICQSFPTAPRSCPAKRPSSTTKAPPQPRVWINLSCNSSRNTVLSGPVNGVQTQVPSIAAEPLHPAVCEDRSRRQAGVPNGSDFPHAVAASAAFALCRGRGGGGATLLSHPASTAARPMPSAPVSHSFTSQAGTDSLIA